MRQHFGPSMVALSRIYVLPEKMLACLKNNRYDNVLILEDDICMSSEVQPIFLTKLLKKLAQLERRYPNFCALSLGGKPRLTTGGIMEQFLLALLSSIDTTATATVA